MELCKYASMQVSKYASKHLSKYVGIQYARMQDWSMQVWKHAGMQVCKYASMQECKNAICYLLSVTCYMLLANWIFLFETCYYLQKLFPFARCCTSRNFFGFVGYSKIKPNHT